MALKTKSFLSPIVIVWPGDPAIDQEKWGESAPGEYLAGIIGGDNSPPMPPEKPGEKCTRFTIRPLNYDAYVHYQHLMQHSAYEDGHEDPEVQRHVIRHTLCDLQHAYYVDDDGDERPIQIELEHGAFGRVISQRTWSDHLIPFLDMGVRFTLVLFCVQHSVGRLSRTLGSRG